jgi:hypothetical protein
MLLDNEAETLRRLEDRNSIHFTAPSYDWRHHDSQGDSTPAALGRCASLIPNPQLKLLDRLREVLRLKHYSLRTEEA